MHQTLYIDIDEEITSVVERLKKAQASEVVIVVPKRALLIQSIVNLRLLKKEADSFGLQLMIVTQDKLGKLLVEKAGILVQQKLDDALEEEEVGAIPLKGLTNASSGEEKITEDEDVPMLAEKQRISQGGKNRLDTIGSASYFDEKGPALTQEIKIARESITSDSPAEEKIVNKELVTGIGSDIKRKVSFASPTAYPNQKALDMEKPAQPEISRMSISSASGPAGYPSAGTARDNYGQDQKLKDFFSHNSTDYTKKEEKMAKPKVSRGFLKKLVLAILIIAITGVAGASAYFFIPQATISLSIKEKVKAQDCEVKGDVNATANDNENEIIPAKLISVSDEATQTFTISGKSTDTNGKAKGIITIYNEFSSSAQSLVATTRFATSDGKIFRLVRGVTIPGTQKDGDQTKPGTIKADVVADQAGDSYNIGATSFTIPGFEDNKDKHDKIYGKSEAAMTGGGSAGTQDNQSSGGTITEADMARAKSQISSAISQSIKEKIKQAGEGLTIMDDAINIEEATYKTTKSVGQAATSFDITANTKASALAFSENNLKEAVGAIIAKASGGNGKLAASDVTLEYGKLLPDFKAGTLDIKVHGISKAGVGFDPDSFKKDILGKTNEQFEAYLSSYPDIEKAEVTYWPPFVSSKIPSYAKRVDIILDTK